LEGQDKETLGYPGIQGWLKETFTEEQVFFLIRVRAINVFVVQNEGKLKNT
jgi:hypothetical protein